MTATPAPMRIPLSSPDVSEADIEAVVAVLKSRHLSLGPRVEEFEAAVAAYVGAPRAVAVSSGTAGLHLCVKALGIGAGDEVILPSFTFVAAANAVRYEGATPVFVDVEESTLNMDPERVEAALTPRTRALLVVHTFGIPAEMDALLDIARRRDLVVIEDACEAIGAELAGRKAGTFGDAGVFAFYPNKQMTTGEGGVIVTRNDTMAARLRSLRNQGRGAPGEWFEHTELGYNYRLSDVACALGLGQLSRIDSILTQRESVARRYDQHLGAVGDLIRPALDMPRRRISWFVYVVRLARHLGPAPRDSIRQRLMAQGIGSGRYFAPIHQQPAYRGYGRCGGPLDVTESEASRCLALPFFNRISDTQIDEVCGRLTEALADLSA